MRLRNFYFIIFVVNFALTSVAFGLTVDEAYQAIPHRRMEYSAQKSTLASETKNDLEKFFKLSDQALVARIETMKGLQQGHTEVFKKYLQETNKILNSLGAFTNPEAIQPTTLLKAAITSQREFFSKWYNAVLNKNSVPALGSDLSVRQASGSLQNLYSVLMTRYPNEHPDNKDAFYQHLCALDFI